MRSRKFSKGTASKSELATTPTKTKGAKQVLKKTKTPEEETSVRFTCKFAGVVQDKLLVTLEQVSNLWMESC